jgi:hypothetical protein
MCNECGTTHAYTNTMILFQTCKCKVENYDPSKLEKWYKQFMKDTAYVEKRG